MWPSGVSATPVATSSEPKSVIVVPPWPNVRVEVLRRSCSGPARCPRPPCRRRRSARRAGSRSRARRRPRVPRSVVTMPSATAEARVGRAVGRVADDREVAVDPVAGREPGDDDLAVGLDGDRVGLVAAAEDVGLDDPAGCRSPGPVCRPAGSARRRSPASRSRPRRCGRRRRSRRRASAPRRRPRRPAPPRSVVDDPAGAEAGVEVARRVVARQREVRCPTPSVRQPAVTMPPLGWITTASPWLAADRRRHARRRRRTSGRGPVGTGGVTQCTATSATSARPSTVPRAVLDGADLVGRCAAAFADLEVVGLRRPRYDPGSDERAVGRDRHVGAAVRSARARSRAARRPRRRP